jgi:hypothetical protein
MNKKAKKYLLLVISLFFITLTTIETFAASNKTPASKIQFGKTGSVSAPVKSNSKIVLKNKLSFDLSIERVWQNNKCEINVEFKNKGQDTIPKALYQKIYVKAVFGDTEIDKKIIVFDRAMKLSKANAKFVWKTKIIAGKSDLFSLFVDKNNIVKETNELNNKKRQKILSRCATPKAKSGLLKKSTRVSKIDKRAIVSVQKLKPISKSSPSKPPLPPPPGPSPSPSPSPVDNGILITRPGEGSSVIPGDVVRVDYHFTRSAPAGDVVFELIDGANIVLRATQPYTPLAEGDEAGGETITFFWPFPETLEPGQNYMILATRDSVYGLSTAFTVGTPGPEFGSSRPVYTSISVLSPSAGEILAGGNTVDVVWTMPGPESIVSCSSRVDVEAVRVTDGGRRRIAYGIDSVVGENTLRWTLQDEEILGTYRIRVTSTSGCVGEGERFEIAACDYAIESVSIRGVGSLERGLDIGSGSMVRGSFDVRIRWNGIPVPSNLPPGTFWNNRLQVRATRGDLHISDPVSGASFTYMDSGSRAAGTFTVSLPFAIEKDSIPSLKVGRHIPLEFSLRSFGASIDSVADNNTFRADMRVTGASENDLHMAPSGSISITRRSRFPGSAPVWRCHFEQTVELTNQSRTDAGGPASTLASVPCRWEIQYRNDGGTSFSTFASGDFTMERVPGGEWILRRVSGDFRVNYNFNDSRSYRLRVTADPEHTLMDPDRRNNTASRTFRMSD